MGAQIIKPAAALKISRADGEDSLSRTTVPALTPDDGSKRSHVLAFG